MNTTPHENEDVQTLIPANPHPSLSFLYALAQVCLQPACQVGKGPKR